MTHSRPSQLGNFLRGPGVSLLLAVLSVAGTFVAIRTGLSPSLKVDPDRVILIAVILFLIGEVLKLSWQTSPIRQSARAMESEIAQIALRLPKIEQSISALPVLHELRDLRDQLQKRRDQIGNAGIETLKKLFTLMEPIPGGRGFIASSETLAIYSYEHFWELLLDQQEKAAKDKPIIVRVTHSSESGIWAKPQLQRSLDLQCKFVEYGGIIVRVFLDATETAPPLILKQMEKMRAQHVHVFYLRNNNSDQLDSDFLWTEPFLVEWISGQLRLALKSCRISEPTQVKRNEISDQWCNIGQRILEEDASQKIDPAVRAILANFSRVPRHEYSNEH